MLLLEERQGAEEMQLECALIPVDREFIEMWKMDDSDDDKWESEVRIHKRQRKKTGIKYCHWK